LSLAKQRDRVSNINRGVDFIEKTKDYLGAKIVLSSKLCIQKDVFRILSSAAAASTTAAATATASTSAAVAAATTTAAATAVAAAAGTARATS
jgi:hypothetical protein